MGLSTSKNTKMIQLLFASICACQVLFMASRAPRVTWEAVYLPLVETILYGMASTGNGSMRLADGRMVPIARFCSWIITCPIMLFQVVGIHEVKVYGISCKNMVMAASLVRTVYGIGASVTIDDKMRWIQYMLSCFTFLFELWCVYQIYNAGLKKFSAVKTPLNNIVHSRIQFLRFLFYLSWSSFPIVWVLSSTGLCLINEDGSVLAYLVADILCKNTYGIINANTLFRVLNGKWEPETEEEAKNGDHSNHVGESYIEQFLAGGRQPESIPSAGFARDVQVRVDGVPAYTPENARLYTEKMHAQAHRLNKAPEHFIDDRRLPCIRDEKAWQTEFSRRGSAQSSKPPPPDFIDNYLGRCPPPHNLNASAERGRPTEPRSRPDSTNAGPPPSGYGFGPGPASASGGHGPEQCMPLHNERERTLSPPRGVLEQEPSEKPSGGWTIFGRRPSAKQ